MEFFYKVLDCTLNVIEERFQLLKGHSSVFRILHHFYELKTTADNDLQENCQMIEKSLTDLGQNQSDINGKELFEELKAFQPHITESMTASEALSYIYENGLCSSFSNLVVLLRIFFTIPVTVASGERSFSKLKIIKNYMRSTMTQERLSGLALISIEHEISDSIDLTSVIKKFADAKVRRVHF